MIVGFEEQTAELSKGERELALALASSFQRRVGKENAITGGEVVKAVNSHHLSKKHKVKMTASRVRKIIHWLVVHGHVKNLVADNSGYYVAKNEKELKQYVEGLIHRSLAIIHKAKAYPVYEEVANGIKQAKIFS